MESSDVPVEVATSSQHSFTNNVDTSQETNDDVFSEEVAAESIYNSQNPSTQDTWLDDYDDAFDDEDSMQKSVEENIFNKTIEEIEKFNKDLDALFTGTFKPATPLEIIGVGSCCAKYCTRFLSIYLIQKYRCSLPLDKAQMREFQFTLVRQCYNNGVLSTVVAGGEVCVNVFAAIYIIPDNRLKVFMKQLDIGAMQGSLHGNDSITHGSCKYYETMAKIVLLLEDYAQDLPTCEGMLMPPGITKKDFMQLVQPDKGLLPNYYLNGIKPSLHWRQTNSFTKCKNCCALRICAQHNKVVNKEEVRRHRQNHWENIKADRADYEVRKMFSRQRPGSLLSLSHDGMSKNKTKLPHLNRNRTKTLGDADMAFFNLNAIIIHRESDDGHGFLIDGYFNVADAFPGGSNSIVSEIINSIVMCKVIPVVVAIQLDNCSANKCYNVLGSLGWLLKKQTKIKEFYVCFNEVGHTHIDIDGAFGRFSQKLNMNECLSPKAMLNLFNTLSGVRQATHLLNVYDFNSILKLHLNNFGKLKGQHMFRIYVNADAVVKVQVAPYIRSSRWLRCVPNSENWDLDVFNTMPDLSLMPMPFKPDFNKLQKLLEVGKKSRELLNDDDMKNYFDTVHELQNFNPPPFETLLDVLKNNELIDTMVTNSHDGNSLLDPENKDIERFLKQNNELVSRMWEKAEEDDVERKQVVANEKGENTAENTINETIYEDSPEIIKTQKATRAGRKRKSNESPIIKQKMMNTVTKSLVGESSRLKKGKK